MNETKERITSIVGAGAVLDFDLPDGVDRPLTSNITKAVVGLQRNNYLTNKPITELADMFRLLERDYPSGANFETLFHALEMMVAYGWVWSHPNMPPKNPKMYPVFAVLTSPKYYFDIDNVRQIVPDVLLTIMDFINTYNAPFVADANNNKWYRDFWNGISGRWDIFNLNYDTTIEHSLDHYEDGFSEIDGQPEFQHFVPQQLWSNTNGHSTICHLHGCIEYFDSRYKEDVYKNEFLKYGFHDMYKYPSYDEVRKYYIGSSKSWQSNQTGEQYVNTPIITGLRKPDKLNSMPFDFYHGYLFNCIMRNRGLLIVGYSFGDIYVNDLIERMELIHGDKKRVVLIDYWKPVVSDTDIDSVPEEDRGPFLRELMKQRTYDEDFSHSMGEFLCRMTGQSDTYNAVGDFLNYDRKGPMISNNGCLMLFIGGFRAASDYKTDIYSFLNS